MIKKILVTGAHGLVGSRFVELFNNKKILLTPTPTEFNLLDYPCMEKYIKTNNVATVLNFAAFTDVAAAEAERGNKKGKCWKVNVDGINNFIKLFDKKSVHFIHISTDMVFPGSADDPGPYSEDHELNGDLRKLSWYGYSKSEGENLLSGYFDKLTILRINYPVRARFNNKLDFLRKSLKLFNEGKLYPLFTDQQISVTFIDETVDLIKKIIKKKKIGTYHCTSSDQTTPYEIVNYLIKAKYCVKDAVKPISIYDFIKNEKHPYRYPVFGGLKADKTKLMLRVKLLSWRDIVDTLIQQEIEPF